MAGSSLNFGAQVSSWVAQTKQRMEAVFKESAQRVVEVMQTPVGAGGRLPLDTGFLRASLRGFNGFVTSANAITPSKGSAAAYDTGSISLVIANAKLGETISVIYTASYAKRMNYGFVGVDSLGRNYSQNGYYFVDTAAQQWPSIVHTVSLELKALNP